ncbi:plastocyanin/azurin family copper-binding protein [Pontibacter sp. E15-1]|uniref:plastocyanin/azurin family copper-binding protein n=1 Tax=Pontibacter sp. E15-1 TaxID=2919918 RepID=UPI001F4F8941|nr:plastocyanin/azurin family copper-binding protein [Pontibacter sp. E15-1]MCJ8166310.1 plastocyanin/azurin family copper-binding protein [Pontibacter sp. E15-1]
MKNRFYTCCVVGASLLLWSCSSPDSDSSATTGTDKAVADSATASSAPLVEDQDTTLQKVEELTLHAIGNTLDEIAYSEDTLEVKAGSHVKLTFKNDGVDMPMMHNVVFTAPDAYKKVAIAGAKIGASGNYIPNDSLVFASSPMTLPGQTVEVVFTAPLKPAAYNYVCTYPDHWQRMHGVLIVKE